MATSVKSYPLSNRINALAESQTLAMARMAREMQEKGQKVIKLNLGEPDFLTPKHVQEAAKQAIDDGYHTYPPVNGYPELRKAVANKLKRDNNLSYTADQIVVSTGAKQSIANVLMCLLNPGDEIIIFSPYWVSYAEQVKLAEATAVYVDGSIENDFKVTAEQVKQAITPKTKAILFSSPCNPTGSVFSKDELEAIANIVMAHEDIFVISDEIYEYINFDGKHESIAQFEGMDERTVIINGMSKGFAMTGWRLGYIAAPLWIAKACNKFQGQITSGACSITQRASIAALEGPLDAPKEMCAAYKRRKKFVVEGLRAIEGIRTNDPQGAFYVFPDVSALFGKSDGNTTINNAFDFAMYLLEKAHVSVVSGEGFGAPNCIRISFAASDEELKEAIQLIGEAVKALK